MIKVNKWLGGSGLAVMVGVLMLALSGSLNATDVAAQSPPTPPARFVGTVTVDGQPVVAGTVVEARIGSASCGVTATFTQGGAARYAVDVEALEPGNSPNCGTEGATVSFYVGGRLAQQTGSWRNFDINILNLTVVTPTATPTAGTPATGTPATGTPGTATTPTTGAGGGGGATPRPPSTGTGAEAGDPAAIWLFALLGAGALAFGAGGAMVARRSR